MGHYKRRKPFLVSLFLWIFWIAIFLALAFGGAWAYFYFGKNVDIASAIGQIGTITKQVDENALVERPITDTYKASMQSKTDALEITSDVAFVGEELGAYINEFIATTNPEVTIGAISVKASDCNFTVAETTILAPSGAEGHLADLGFVVKFDSAPLKDYFSAFPLSMVQNSLPETFYASVTAQIWAGSEGQAYVIVATGFCLNGLDENGTENLIGLLGTFVDTAGFEQMETSIATALVLPILGSDAVEGLADKMNEKTPVGFEVNYAFETAGGQTKFVLKVEPAIYNLQVRQKLGENQGANVGAITGTGEIYAYGADATLTVTPNTGYRFDGWYRAESLVSTENTLVVKNITSNMLYYAHFSYITASVTYENTLGAFNPNPSTYNISFGTFALERLEKDGYAFKGWFSEPNGAGQKVLSINASSLAPVVVYAHWELVTYTINYDLRGGTLSAANPTTYTIETPSFTLTNPTRTSTEFAGWTGTGLSETTLDVTIAKGTFGNLAFEARYLDDTSVFLYVDGELKEDFSAPYGTMLTSDLIYESTDIETLNTATHSIKNWYTSPSLTTLFEPAPIVASISLYTTHEYFTDTVFFYPYLAEFDAAVQNGDHMTFDSREKLLAWIDYVVFYWVQYNEAPGAKNPTFTITYMNGTNAEKKAEVWSVYQNIYGPQSAYQSVSYSVYYASEGFFISPRADSTDDITQMASLTADPQRTQTQPQDDSAFLMTAPKSRAENFNDFKAFQRPKQVRVSNSEQLAHALEQGYNPVCQPASTAETILNEAKKVLRAICSDQMTDLEKIRAIYEWVVMNVQYDHLAANTITDANLTRKYRAWFSEGVFLDKVAVCEGIAKSIAIMANLEGISAVVVTNPGHAWNKVAIDGKWYGLDATHGNVSIGGQKEVISYTKFLFPDSYRPNYVASEYAETAQATTDFNYFANTTITYNSQTFDLVANSQSELTQIFQYVAANMPASLTSTTFSIEVASTASNFTQFIYPAAASAGLSYNSFVQQSTSTPNQTAYLMIFNKAR